MLLIAALPALGGCGDYVRRIDKCVEGDFLVNSDEGFEPVAGYVCVEGDLNVCDVSSLAPLQHLERVTGTLTVRHTDGLEDLSGLESLREAGTLAITGNDELLTLDPVAPRRLDELVLFGNDSLQEIESLSGALRMAEMTRVEIEGHPELQSLEGLGGVDAIGELNVVDNAALASLNGLSPTRAGLIVILANEGLRSLDGLDRLEEAETLTLRENPEITDALLPGTRSLGRLEVWQNPRLRTVSSPLGTMDSLAVGHNRELRTLDLAGVGRLSSLNVSANLDLPSLSGLSGIEHIDEAVIVGNPALTQLELSDLRSATSLVLENNDRLASLGVFEVAVGESVSILDNDDLEQLDGLEATTRLDTLSVGGNAKLLSLGGLERLQQVVKLAVSDNDSLTTLSSLGALSEAEDVFISDNASLTDLAGLSALEDLFVLHVVRNDLLVDLVGLESLRWVRSTTRISDNSELQSLAALGALEDAGIALWLTGNPKIPCQDGVALGAQLEQMGWTGTLQLDYGCTP